MANSKSQQALEAARDSLAAFCRYTYPRFQQPKHIGYIIEHLEKLERGEIERLMIECPPRHAKSWTSSWFFPSWYLGRHPEQNIIHVSYGDALARDFGLKIRNTMADPRFARVFPRAGLRPDSHAVHRFVTNLGGNYFAVGYGGPVTGRGADLLIVDDAIKNMAEAQSAAHRQTLRSYYESTLYTRLEPGARAVMIGTRWHQDDLMGWLQRESEDRWTVLRLPALAEPGDPLGRPEGYSLWPERYPVAKLAKIRRQIGSVAWLAEYQQRPAAVEGAVFKRGWWQYWTEATLPARFEQTIVSLDTAYKSTATADYSVGLVVGLARTGYYVLDIWRDRAEFPALKRAVEMLVTKWNPDRVLIEDKVSGQSLIQELKLISRAPIFPIRVDSDKVSRANAATPVVEAGKVFLPQGAGWLIDFLDEVSSFPNAAHDDMVDALTQALNYLRSSTAEPAIIGYLRERVAQMRADVVQLRGALPMPSAEELRLADGDNSTEEEGNGGERAYARYLRGLNEAGSGCAHCHRAIRQGETYADCGTYKLHKSCQLERRAQGLW